MDGQIKKRRTLEAIKRIALRESLNQPLMVMFEDLHRRRGGAVRLQYFAALLAFEDARMGQTENALATLNEAVAHIERTGEKAHETEILRLKGEIVLMHLMHYDEAIDQAEACFRSALEVSRTQEAKWWELRTSVSLARLLRDTNRRDEARSTLAEIYNWFTEGFELPDLKEANELLEELNG
jgi:hypothetical protein